MDTRKPNPLPSSSPAAAPVTATEEKKQAAAAPAFDPTKTARPVAALKHATSQPAFWQGRARGTRATPLTRGEHALLFVSLEDLAKAGTPTRPDADRVQSIGVRARWINKVYQNYIKVKGCRQIIILGSGFDARPYKKNAANQVGKKNAAAYGQVKFYEVDSDKILDVKEQLFAEAKLDKNATYIRGDYTDQALIEKLTKAGVDFKQPTLFIWEGNIYYLDKAQVAPLVARLKEAFSDFALTFDYFTQSCIDETRKKIPQLPWKTGIQDIGKFAEESGLKLLAHRNIGDLAKEYEVDLNPQGEGLESYHVCTLGN